MPENHPSGQIPAKVQGLLAAWDRGSGKSDLSKPGPAGVPPVPAPFQEPAASTAAGEFSDLKSLAPFPITHTFKYLSLAWKIQSRTPQCPDRWAGQESWLPVNR